MTLVAASTKLGPGVMAGRNELVPTGLSVCGQVSGAVVPPLELSGTHVPAEPHTCPVGQCAGQVVAAGVDGLLEPQALARRKRRDRAVRRVIQL